LDVCSAPGSKATQMGIWLCGQGDFGNGVLVANDPDEQRAATLRANLIRAGLLNTWVSRVDGRTLGELAPEQFDAVLVDAPCSGEGTSRKNPLALLRAYAEDDHGGQRIASDKALLDKQLEMLRSAWRALRPGGCLIYSTCTLNRWENEVQIQRFLDAEGEKGTGEPPQAFGQQYDRYCARGMDVSALLDWPPEIARNMGLAGDCGSLRFWPQSFDVEGFFVACLVKVPLGTSVASSQLPARGESRSVPKHLRPLPPNEASNLKNLTEQRVGFWPGSVRANSEDLGCLYEDPCGKVWLLPDLGVGLETLVAHSSEPGLLVAHASRCSSALDQVRFELSDELFLLAGDRAQCPVVKTWTLEDWEKLFLRAVKDTSKGR